MVFSFSAVENIYIYIYIDRAEHYHIMELSIQFRADLPSLNLNSITPDLYSLFPMNIQTATGRRRGAGGGTLFPPSIEYPKN